jgi:hypothetical protein
MKSEIVLKSVLLLIGVAVILLGLNIGLGGIRTLGWQMSGAFFEVTNETLFRAHDSHIRFIGGVWFGVGVVYLFGGFFLDALRPALVVLCAVIAVAGLFRLSGLFLGAEFSPAIWTSFALEVIGFPCLGWWLGQPFMQRFKR